MELRNYELRSLIDNMRDPDFGFQDHVNIRKKFLSELLNDYLELKKERKKNEENTNNISDFKSR